MVSSDTVVGIVGAVILTGAMVAVFYYENTTAGDGDPIIGTGNTVYTFEYRQTNDSVEAVSETFERGPDDGPRQFNFTLPAYVYDLHAVVTWDVVADQLSGVSPAERGTVKVHFVNNDGNMLGDMADASGEIHTGHAAEEHDHNETKPPEEHVRVRGNSTEDAQANLQQNTSKEHGVGDWTFVVEVTAPGDHTGNQQRGRDQSITVHVTYQYWKPHLVE